MPDMLPRLRATLEIAEAKKRLYREESEFIRWPWGAVDEMCGAMAGGQIWFVCGFRGKTLFVLNALDRWAENGLGIYVAPLETSQADFRLAWAALRVGVDPGMVLDGSLAYRSDTIFRPRIDAELERMADDEGLRGSVVLQENQPFLTLDVFNAGIEEAVDAECRIAVFDHIDHLRPEADMHKQSVEIVLAAHEAAIQHNLVILFTSQLNSNKILGPNRLAVHMPPQLHQIYLGDHKRHAATGILGVYRPVRLPKHGEEIEAYTATLSAAREGKIEPQGVLAENTMAVCLMKSRHSGKHEGKRNNLELLNGRLRDIPLARDGRYEV